MRRSSVFYVGLLILGACLVAASFFFDNEEFKAVSGTLIGIGAGSAGLSVSNLLMIRAARKNPGHEKQIRIDYHDERNTLIRNRAKAKAGDITQWLVMAIAYITILISAPLWVTMAVVAVFLIYNFMSHYLIFLYQKNM
ncbi:hypothetical protein C2I18_28210 [Paenibacillus sp. PK3_47]|uniref:hypothetical protein n=1 Tax=Paenibacillus sp. PK3_47 TaxID=2072642 RepID=UPI00201E612C|nr:hypothetical protein [Paenibacillus sp. PK3_47]UQZ37080.1 hypothetical protein C2I18_28210 [Paenibacillus sp. PK3_47]